MTYRAGSLTINLVPLAALVTVAIVGLWWIFDADQHTNDPIVRRRPRPAASPRHRGRRPRLPADDAATGRAVPLDKSHRARAATSATLDDGSVTVRLRSTKLLTRRGSYFFPHPPRRRVVVMYNLSTEPEVVIELHAIDYEGVKVRRRLSGAYRLRGLVEAGATIHPYPTETR